MQSEDTLCQDSGCINNLMHTESCIHTYMQSHTSINTHNTEKKRVLVEQSLFHTWPVFGRTASRLSVEELLHLFEFHTFLLSFGCKCHLERWRGHEGKGRWRSSGRSRNIRAMTWRCKGRFSDFGSLGKTSPLLCFTLSLWGRYYKAVMM